MKIIKKIVDVEKTLIIQNKFIYKSNDKLFKFNGKDSTLILNNVYDYYIKGNFIFYQENNLESLYRLNIQNGEVEQLQGLFSLKGGFGTSQESIYILGKYKNEKVYFKISLNEYIIESIIPYSMGLPEIFNENFCIVEYRDSIKSLGSLFENELWHYTLPEGFKIFGSVQAIDDLLFFRITDRNLDNSKNVGLDIKTGEILWEIENTTYFQIDHKNKLLRGYQGAYYQVIDPFEGKLLINKDLKELWDKGIDPDAVSNTIIDDKLWFVSGRGENAKFGAINLETSEIDFIQDFPLENDGQLDKPVYHKGKLYLLDSNNVLHILE